MLYTFNDWGAIEMTVTAEVKKSLIEIEHIKHGKSLRLIERENGLSNDTLRKFAITHNIQTRSRVASIRANIKHIDYPSGDRHWRASNKEASEKLSKLHSDNMKKNNPSHNLETRLKIRKSLTKTLKKNPTFHEQLFIECFYLHDISYEHQYNTGEYIADFCLNGYTTDGILLELDGRGHAGRYAADRIRDKRLTDMGFNVVRVQQDSVFNKRAKNPVFRPFKLLSVIEDVWGVSGYFGSWLVPDGGKYRVIVRYFDGTEEIY